MGLLYFGPNNNHNEVDLKRVIVSIHNDVDVLGALQFSGDNTQMCKLCRIITPFNNAINYKLLRCIKHKYNRSKNIELSTVYTFKDTEVNSPWWLMVKYFTTNNIIPPYDIIDDIIRTAFDIATAMYYDIKVIYSCLSKDQMVRDYCVNLANTYGKTIVMDSNAISCTDIKTMILNNSGIKYNIPLMALSDYDNDRDATYNIVFNNKEFHKFIINYIIYNVNFAYVEPSDDYGVNAR